MGAIGIRRRWAEDETGDGGGDEKAFKAGRRKSSGSSSTAVAAATCTLPRRVSPRHCQDCV